jgi:hypothetical protein
MPSLVCPSTVFDFRISEPQAQLPTTTHRGPPLRHDSDRLSDPLQLHPVSGEHHDRRRDLAPPHAHQRRLGPLPVRPLAAAQWALLYSGP